jgi:aspartyl-tRNA(Asn)/glutamyl-tRNA(Gln) amidotransferase subunit A
MASSLDVVGPLTKSSADTRIMYDVMRGRDDRDATSFDLTSTKVLAGKSLKGLRVGIPSEYFLPGLDTGSEGSVQKALKKMTAQGATLVDISLPHTEYGLATYYVIMPAEASTNLSRYDGVRFGTRPVMQSATLATGYADVRSYFGTEVQRRILIGAYVLSAGYYDAFYRQAQKVRTLITRDFNDAFKNVDVIAAPTSPTPAWEVGEKADDPLSMYLSDIFTVTANLAGVPAISLPCAAANELPIGLQLIAARGNDSFLLDVAEAFETGS